MKTRLIVLTISVSLGGFGCGSSSGTAAMAPGSNSQCQDSSCVSGSGGASSLVGTSPNGIPPDTDAGTLWSPLCGPIETGCLPDPDAGSCGDVYAVHSGLDAGVGDGGASDDDIELTTCRIQPGADPNSIQRLCFGTGAGKSGDSCSTPSDCGSGLTCVMEDIVAVCRPYCCANPESCPSDSYCTTRTTCESLASLALGADVPVCTKADECSLADPCPQGQNCCPSGKACAVVRRQGLTACTNPGTGVQGDYCTCANGYVQGDYCSCAPGFACSYTTFTCLKLCQLDSADASTGATSPGTTCSTGTSCQLSNDVPSGWGVCSDVPMLID